MTDGTTRPGGDGLRAAWRHFRDDVRAQRRWRYTVPVGASGPEGCGYREVSRFWYLVERYVAGPLFAAEQAYGCRLLVRDDGDGMIRTRWPEWPLRLVSGLAYAVETRVARRARYWRWIAPDDAVTDGVQEIGYHWPMDTPMPTPRPRVFRVTTEWQPADTNAWTVAPDVPGSLTASEYPIQRAEG